MRFRNRQSVAFAVIAFLGSLCMVDPITAQDRSAAPLPNTVWVGADGKFEAQPDTVLVQFNISAQEDKLPDANQKASRGAEQVRQLLRSNGLDPKDAQVGQFSVQPVYDYKTPKRKLVGYRVDTNISIKLKDFSKVGPITEGLSNMADVTGDQSLSYLLDDMEAAKVKAVEDALPRARAMANAVARFSGRTLGELSYASVDTYEPNPVHPMVFAKQASVGAMAAPAPPTAEFGAQKINGHGPCERLVLIEVEGQRLKLWLSISSSGLRLLSKRLCHFSAFLGKPAQPVRASYYCLRETG